MEQRFKECGVSAVSRCSVWVCCVITAMMLFFAVVGAAEQGGPVRVEVLSNHLEVPEGSDTQITVQLVDAGGTRVPAGKTVQVQVKIDREDTISRTVPVTFRPGESARDITIPASEAGVLSVEATSEELLKGATLLRVQPPSRRMLMMRMSPDAGNDSPESRSVSPLGRRSDERSDIVLTPDEREGAAAPPDRGLALIGELPAASTGHVIEHATASGGGGQVPSGLPLSLELRAFPDRPLRADGADPAKIFAFVHGEPDHPGIRLTLLNSLGRLAPRELHIPTGQTAGEASLTSDRPGEVTVDLVGTVPALDISGQRKLAFEFHPPIDGLAISAPRELDIGDIGDLAVDLVNVSGTPVRSMEPRKLEFRVLEGKVRIKDPEAEIPAGGSGARTELSADWWGNAEIEVATPNLSKQRISVTIGLPWGLLAVTALGGMLGGLIAWAHGPEKHQYLVLRLLVGLVAGFMLYWLLAYLTLPGTSDLVRNVAVRNAFGAFCSSVVGGWLGTEVFDIAARRLGLARSPG